MSTRRESEDLPRFEETAGEVCLTSKYGKQRNCSELEKNVAWPKNTDVQSENDSAHLSLSLGPVEAHSPNDVGSGSVPQNLQKAETPAKRQIRLHVLPCFTLDILNLCWLLLFWGCCKA